MELVLPENSLVVFVDDTGHEELKGQPFYGLGGCTVLTRDLEATIRIPWREVRRSVTGSPDTPLHAANFSRNATPDQIEAVASFFRTQPFGRLGAILTGKTVLHEELSRVQAIAKVLKSRIVEIAQWTLFDRVAVIFEASERANRLIQDAFQGFGLEEKGKPIPVECFFMPKKAGEPGLEVADFIMHAVGRQARQNLTERGQFKLDFAAVFHSVDKKLVSFMEISAMVIADSTERLAEIAKEHKLDERQEALLQARLLGQGKKAQG